MLISLLGQAAVDLSAIEDYHSEGDLFLQGTARRELILQLDDKEIASPCKCHQTPTACQSLYLRCTWWPNILSSISMVLP